MIKKYGTTVLGIFFLMILLAGAFTVPLIINHVYDNRTLGQINTQEVKLSMYEFSYQSFEEKLRTIGRAMEEGTDINLIELSQNVTAESTMSNEALTKKAVGEVDLLLHTIMGLDISISENSLFEKSLFAVFGQSSDNGENVLTGINVYRLSFQTEKGVLSFYMDAEFFKIYAFVLENFSGDTGGYFVDLKAGIPQMLCEYWELEQEYAFASDEYGAEGMPDLSTDSSWAGYGEDILIYEDGVSLYLISELTVTKYGTNILMGVYPFTYMY